MSNKPMSMFEMLMAASANAAQAKTVAGRQPWPVNPFPRGVRAGSVTDQVLRELIRVAPQALEAGQLRMRCNAGRGAIAWAVAYLIELGEIQALTDPRHPAYRRYRLAAKTTGENHE